MKNFRKNPGSILFKSLLLFGLLFCQFAPAPVYADNPPEECEDHIDDDDDWYCDICGEELFCDDFGWDHEFTDGVCDWCLYECPHDGEISGFDCTTCGKYLYCQDVGEEHWFIDGECLWCGYECDHVDDDDDWYCDICGAELFCQDFGWEHTFEDGVCTRCLYECEDHVDDDPDDWYCDICGKELFCEDFGWAHEFVDGVCIWCLKTLSIDSCTITGPSETYVGAEETYTCTVTTSPAGYSDSVSYQWSGIFGNESSENVTFMDSPYTISCTASIGGQSGVPSGTISPKVYSIKYFQIDGPAPSTEVITDVQSSVPVLASASGANEATFAVDVSWTSEGGTASGWQSSIHIEQSHGFTVRIDAVAERGSEKIPDDTSVKTINRGLEAEYNRLIAEKNTLVYDIAGLFNQLAPINAAISTETAERDRLKAILDNIVAEKAGYETAKENFIICYEVADETAMWVSVACTGGTYGFIAGAKVYWEKKNPVQGAIDEAMGYYVGALADELARRLLNFGDEEAITASYNQSLENLTGLYAQFTPLNDSYKIKVVRLDVVNAALLDLKGKVNTGD